MGPAEHWAEKGGAVVDGGAQGQEAEVERGEEGKVGGTRAGL